MSEPMAPIVLVGGRSRRFGRDKLREPVQGCWLVDHPIRALREVFGPRVAVVGECHPEVAARADMVIPDRYPGVGPIGGILSALEHTQGSVFVLPGDLPRVSGGDLLAILGVATRCPEAWAVLSRTDAPEPCVGLYRLVASGSLRDRMLSGRMAIYDAIPPDQVVWVPMPASSLLNLNKPEDLP